SEQQQNENFPFKRVEITPADYPEDMKAFIESATEQELKLFIRSLRLPLELKKVFYVLEHEQLKDALSRLVATGNALRNQQNSQQQQEEQ
ncbi:MAG: hypothetical protein VKK42_23430, partial [Lyngbya sp.]|nr:hypothetical protein [Lyngbya sp.]